MKAYNLDHVAIAVHNLDDAIAEYLSLIHI